LPEMLFVPTPDVLGLGCCSFFHLTRWARVRRCTIERSGLFMTPVGTEVARSANCAGY
jgi:hypothetical protein